MFGLDLVHGPGLLWGVIDLDNIIITIIVISCACLRFLTVVCIVSVVNCFPLSIGLDRDLVDRTRSVLQDVLYIVVDTEALIRESLVADRASPSWSLLLQLQEVRTIKALVVRANIRPARDADAHS